MPHGFFARALPTSRFARAQWRILIVFAFIAATTLTLLPSLAFAQTSGERYVLKNGWTIQSSTKVTGKGQEISESGYYSGTWYSATVPSTVVSALVDNHVYPDPYFGTNLRQFPGMNYKIGSNFSNEEMPKDSPFKVSWWYRTEFIAPRSVEDKKVWLGFKGINYRANIWLNGHQVAKADDVAGAFRRYEFEIGALINAGQKNALAVEVFPPSPHDLAITFVDWNPLPPDKDMGLWGEVYLITSGAVAIRHPYVGTKFDLPSLSTAHLTVRAMVTNSTAQSVSGTLRGSIDRAQFSLPVTLAANETKEITFAPDQFPDLNLIQPRVWWPYQMGRQDMYDLHLEFDIGSEVSDVSVTAFGISQVTSEMNPEHYLQFLINGKKILIRGGGWTPDMFVHQDPQRWEDDFRYVRGMNLNAVRLEGKLMDDAFFRLADRYGILVMPGWCCCDHWEKWDRWHGDERKVAVASLRDQILRLREHPSVIDWMNGSDNPPPPEIEKAYLQVEAEAHWDKPIISSAKRTKTPVTGDPGVKMPGPYDYVPPNYWLEDKENGGAFGFNTETSAGAAIPPIDSLKKMLPPDAMWPINEFWNYHAGGEQFKDLKYFSDVLEKRYGPSRNLADYEWKAQATAYENERAMFEAYGRNQGSATGVIQWMLNNAWPSMIWHLYDFYMRPGGGYFGAKKACEPIHIQYSYDDHSIAVVNNEDIAHPGSKIHAQILDINGKEKYTHDETADIAANAVLRSFKIPDTPGLSTTYFLRLTLTDSNDSTLSTNFYWLSTKPDVLGFKGSTWFYTPETAYGDFRALAHLSPVSLVYTLETTPGPEQSVAHVHLSNSGDHLAMLVHLRLTRGTGGEEILPILWDDNYFELMPGESRDISAEYRNRDAGTEAPALEVSGWNVSSGTQQ